MSILELWNLQNWRKPADILFSDVCSHNFKRLIFCCLQCKYMKSFIVKRVITILVNLWYLILSCWNINKIIRKFVILLIITSKIYLYILMRKVSLGRYYFVLYDDALTLIMPKWRLTRFAMKLFIFTYNGKMHLFWMITMHFKSNSSPFYILMFLPLPLVYFRSIFHFGHAVFVFIMYLFFWRDFLT